MNQNEHDSFNVMEKDVYQQLTETLNNGIIQTNEDIDDEGQHTGESIDNLDDELQRQTLSESEEIDRPKIIRKNGQIVDEDGKTYEDYLKEMGVDVDMPEGHYVNNAELYKHMVAYCEARDKALAEGKPKPPVDNFIGEAIMKIATHLSFRPNFIGYSYRMDMIGDAIDNCLTYIDSFDPKKSKNPFSYLTQVCLQIS